MTDKTVIKVAQDDTVPVYGQIDYGSDADVTLTGATVQLYTENSAGMAKTNGLLCGVVIDDTAKTIDWQAPVSALDFDTAGIFYPYLVVTHGDGVVETIRLWETNVIKVVARGLV